MNRRGFLKSLLYTAGAASLPFSIGVSGFKEAKPSGGNDFDTEFTKRLMKSFAEALERERLKQLKITKLERL